HVKVARRAGGEANAHARGAHGIGNCRGSVHGKPFRAWLGEEPRIRRAREPLKSGSVSGVPGPSGTVRGAGPILKYAVRFRGEEGIRTLGKSIMLLQRFSKPPPSTSSATSPEPPGYP